jgi:hypothetical protein
VHARRHFVEHRAILRREEFQRQHADIVQRGGHFAWPRGGGHLRGDSAGAGTVERQDVGHLCLPGAVPELHAAIRRGPDHREFAEELGQPS